MPSVLFLTQGDEKLASTRFRVLAYLKRSPKDLSCCVLPLTNGGMVTKVFFLFKAIIKSRNFDTVMVQKLLLPKAVLFFLKRFSGRLIYDFDDALFTAPPGQLYTSSMQKRKKKLLEKTLRSVDQVLCGNHYLQEFSKRFNPNCLIQSTPVDTHVYQPVGKKSGDKLILGWTGRAENLDYLEELSSVFSKIGAFYGERVCLVVFCDKPYRFNGPLQVINIPWRLEEEAQMIASFDVGIMPLSDSPWARGKCAFKLIQYMACGVASVASPVGMNVEVVTHGVNGFLANSEDDWFDCINELLCSRELREKFAQEGRSDVCRFYSLEATSPQFFETLNS